jgi:hypothetical protein
LAARYRNGPRISAALAQGAGHREEAARVQGAQGRDQDDEHDHRDVLDQRDADHHASVPRVQLATVHQQAGHHHRARDGDDHAHHDALDGRPAEQGADGRSERDREHHAEGGAHHGHPLHAQQVAQGQLDPDREHEQDHADLREQLEPVDLGDGEPGGERAQQETAQHVTEDQRLARAPGQAAADDGADEDQREVPEEDGIADHGRAAGTKVVRTGRP